MAHTYRSLEEAVSLLLAQFSPSPCTEEVPLSQALNRVCAGDVTAAVDHPPFDRSPLDGYAARSEDFDGASPSSPAVLDVKQRIYAGQVPAGPLQPDYDRLSHSSRRGLRHPPGGHRLWGESGTHFCLLRPSPQYL